MMLPALRTATIGLLLAAAPPLFAQVAAPLVPPAPMQHGMRGDRMHGGGMAGGPRSGGHRSGGPMFNGLSEAGRATMQDAMRAGGDPRADRNAVKAARDRMLTVLDAERLDTAALKRAMDDERRLAEASRDNRQAAMLAGFSKLSTADRKAFVTNARAMKTRMETRIARLQQRGSVPAGDVPLPPPM